MDQSSDCSIVKKRNQVQNILLNMPLLAFTFFIAIVYSGVSAVDPLDDIIQRLAKVEKDLADLRTQTQDPKAIFQASLNALFTPSDAYQGKRYWLTKQAQNIRVADAQALCQRYGGYLAEFDTNEEYLFAQSFVGKASRFSYVITGGTDGIKEGEWFNRYGLSLTAPSWGKGEPNNLNEEDCLCLASHLSWAMNDCNCKFYVNETGFLCEIPE